MAKEELIKENPIINSLSDYDEVGAKGLLERIDKILYGQAVFTEREHKPTRDKCAGCKSKTKDDNEYEKRICRCLYYFNKKDGEEGEICASCAQKDNPYFQLRVVGDYTVTNYEVPPHRDSDGVGEIDLLLADERYYYATEVKPPRSNETLLRMILEIITYCNGEALNKKSRTRGDRPVKKAILFFKHTDYTADKKEYTEQYKEYTDSKYAHYGKYTKRLIDLFGIYVFCADVYTDEYGRKCCNIELLN